MRFGAYTVVKIRVVIFWIMNLEERNCLHLQGSNIRAHLPDQTTHQTGVCLILYSVARRLSLQRLCVQKAYFCFTSDLKSSSSMLNCFIPNAGGEI